MSVARVVVDNDDKGGTARDPIIWSAGSSRKVDWAVKHDLADWAFGVGSLVEVVCFFKSLHWPTEVSDFGMEGRRVLMFNSLSLRMNIERVGAQFLCGCSRWSRHGDLANL